MPLGRSAAMYRIDGLIAFMNFCKIDIYLMINHYQWLTQEGYPSIGLFKKVILSFQRKGPTHPVKEGHDGNGRSNAGAGGEQVKEQTEVPDQEFGFKCGNLSWKFLALTNLLL